MRRSPIIATLALALSVCVPPTSSQAAPSHDQITGTGTAGQFGAPQLHVNAVQTRNGVKGGFTIQYPDGTTVTGRVTLLAVAGPGGCVTGVITQSSGPRQVPNNWLPGNYLAIGVEDAGEPGTTGPDLLNFSPGFTSDPGCGPGNQAAPSAPVVSGNYQVFDAT